MDPDACLKEILELNEVVGNFVDSYGDDLSSCEDGELEEFLADANNLVDHISGLNNWLEKGGFLPEKWRAPPTNQTELNAHTLSKIQKVIWPEGDATRQWPGAKLVDIGILLREAGFGPEKVDGD
jgi:hypothetical protein